MKIIELYSDDILDVIGTGQIPATFNEENGDYIKMEIRDIETGGALYTFYSNRLLLEQEMGGYYFGDYHFNSTTDNFMVGQKHINTPHGNLLPTRYNKYTDIAGTYTTTDDIVTTYYTFKKQINIYRDDNNRIYIKPNELLEKINLEENEYKLVIYFLQDIKSPLTKYLHETLVNWIPNGNFLGGKWANDDDGSILPSISPNTIIQLANPGLGKYILEQDGHGNNKYEITILGIDENTDYVISCWSAYNIFFNGWKGMFHVQWIDQDGLVRSHTQAVPGWTIETKIIGDLMWEHRYLILPATLSATKIKWYLGYQTGQVAFEGGGYDSLPDDMNSRRYFTDLRFETLEESSIRNSITALNGQYWSHYPETDKRDANWTTPPVPQTPQWDGIIPDLVPLYRFWNDTKRKHFYTMSKDTYLEMKNNPNFVDWKFVHIECYVPHIYNHPTEENKVVVVYNNGENQKEYTKTQI